MGSKTGIVVAVLAVATVLGFGLPGGESVWNSSEAAEAKAATGKADYQRSRWDPIHFSPDIDKATDEQCLACHKEILEDRPLTVSPAGLKADDSLAWYQTLDTYQGEQDTFHRRHLTTPFAEQVMDLSCTFCHRGNDPREEAPAPGVDTAAGFTLRKMVDPAETCLLCHGRFPSEFMEGVEGPWHEARDDIEDADNPNGCLVCHAEQFRTVRHQVTYLNADTIETLAKKSSDVCYGCHGGRAWYRTSYPYPRHAWPEMPEEMPEWAVGRPTESAPRFLAKTAK